MVVLSPTAQLRQRASSLRESGRPVYDFSAGELDFATPAHVVAAAVEAAGRPENHHYGPTAGEPDLRRAVAERVGARARHPLGPSNVLITHGAKQALFNTFTALLQADDEVLVPAPYWVTFPSSVQLAGGTPVLVTPSGGMKVTAEDLEAAHTPATRVIVLCSPGNPSGLVYGEDELHGILAWAVRHDVWVVADETYIDLAFRPVPAPALVEPRLAERLVTVGGVSKSFAMTGWRVGWAVGPAEVIATATAAQSHTTSNVSRIAQAAALAALTGAEVPAGFRVTLQHRLGLCKAILDPLGLYAPPDGGFYLFPDVTHFDPDDLRLADRLLDAGIVAVPGSSFGCPGRIRLSFAIAESELVAGLLEIARVLKRRSQQL